MKRRRTADLLLSGIGLVIASPLMTVLACAVYIDSGGPVIFRQSRVGRGGQVFTIYKFRTMRPSSGGYESISASNDPRITRVGKWLRSSKMDELPQLWNVATGDMSLVGPRPEVPMYVALWPEESKKVILSVRPGITDPAALRYRRESELLGRQLDPEAYYRTVVLPDKVRVYRDYVVRRRASSDIKLILETLWAAVAR